MLPSFCCRVTFSKNIKLPKEAEVAALNATHRDLLTYAKQALTGVRKPIAGAKYAITCFICTTA